MTKHNVLIIDDDLSVCKEIKYSLASDSIAAYYVRSLPEGLNALSKKRHEAVVLNISFPESDGLELLKYLRHLDNMPILVLSAKPSSAQHGKSDGLLPPGGSPESCRRPSTALPAGQTGSRLPAGRHET